MNGKKIKELIASGYKIKAIITSDKKYIKSIIQYRIIKNDSFYFITKYQAINYLPTEAIIHINFHKKLTNILSGNDFSKKVEYALIALVEMDNGGGNVELITAKSLAEQFHIPTEIMGKVLQTLVKGGLLFSVQGVKGGYTLARSLGKISVLELINSVDGEIGITSCINDSTGNCAQYEYCTIRTPMEVVQNELEDFFNKISVLDIKNKYAGKVLAL